MGAIEMAEMNEWMLLQNKHVGPNSMEIKAPISSKPVDAYWSQSQNFFIPTRTLYVHNNN